MPRFNAVALMTRSFPSTFAAKTTVATSLTCTFSFARDDAAVVRGDVVKENGEK